MVLIIVLLILCAANTHYCQEGDRCNKNGVPGVCTTLKQCPDAIQDIKNKIRPQHCVYGTLDPIVCCVSATPITTTTERPQKCILPPYPEHGTYTANVAGVVPGEALDFFLLNITCNPGYGMDGPRLLFCRDGWWPERMSYCISNSCINKRSGAAGVCTKLKQCPAARQDIRSRIPPQHCWFGSVEAIVCCVPPANDGATTVIPTTTTKRTEVSTQHTTTPSNEVAMDPKGKCDPLPLSLSPKPTGKKAWDKCLEYQDKLVFPCGESDTRNYSRSNRCHHHADKLVTGGVTAEPYEFPHVGLLGYGTDPANLRWLCGGTLISEKFVLTAAHCSASREDGDVSYVQLGILQRSAMPEKDRYRVQRIIKHPQYKPGAKYNDIALVELKKSVPLDEFIVPACLIGGVPVNDTRAVFTGWGSVTIHGEPSDYLKKLVMTEFGSEECSTWYPPARLMKNGVDNETQVCFGDRSGFINTCQGDSGGPLQIKSKRIACMYSVIGVSSFGKSCGGSSKYYAPDMYTRVAPYIDWIEETVWP